MKRGDELIRHALTFAGSRDGGAAMMFALALPALLFAVGVSIDYASMLKYKVEMQKAADTAALAGARELRMGSSNAATIDTVTRNAAQASLASLPAGAQTSVASSLLDQGASVQVSIGLDVQTLMGGLLIPELKHINVLAKARMRGGAPICVIALNPSTGNALNLNKNARLTGATCAIYSDSTDANGIATSDSAIITAALICSAGGVSKGTGGMSPAPQTDCPAIPDPLAARAQPAVGACAATNLVIRSGTQSLNPGVYCGGIRVTGGASVTVNPGTFIIKDGSLTVDNNSTLTGTDVGFYFTGAGAKLNFAGGANTISLSAPVSGLLAGLLFFEDRSVASGQIHQILSDNARTLLGTIYLSRGRLRVASNAPVADQSAYTVIVADMIELSEGPNLVLNTNYGSTTVPVPDGVGPGVVALQQ